jgi:hypothetical protein
MGDLVVIFYAFEKTCSRINDWFISFTVWGGGGYVQKGNESEGVFEIFSHGPWGVRFSFARWSKGWTWQRSAAAGPQELSAASFGKDRNPAAGDHDGRHEFR